MGATSNSSSPYIQCLSSGPVGTTLAAEPPGSTSSPALPEAAALAAVLANVINNLPGTLVLLAAL